MLIVEAIAHKRNFVNRFGSARVYNYKQNESVRPLSSDYLDYPRFLALKVKSTPPGTVNGGRH